MCEICIKIYGDITFLMTISLSFFSFEGQIKRPKTTVVSDAVPTLDQHGINVLRGVIVLTPTLLSKFT